MSQWTDEDYNYAIFVKPTEILNLKTDSANKSDILMDLINKPKPTNMLINRSKPDKPSKMRNMLINRSNSNKPSKMRNMLINRSKPADLNELIDLLVYINKKNISAPAA
jgi:hypothetical protein